MSKLMKLARRITLAYGLNAFGGKQEVSLVAGQTDSIIKNKIVDSFFIADAFSVGPKMGGVIKNPQPHSSVVAMQWSSHPIYCCITREVCTHVGSGVVYFPDNDKYLTETGWGWGRYRTLNTERYKSSKAIRYESKLPVYIFSHRGWHGVVEDLASVVYLANMGVKFEVAIDKSNSWMCGLLSFLLPPDITIVNVKSGRWLSCPFTISTTKSAFGEFPNPKLIQFLNEHVKLYVKSSEEVKIFISRQDTNRRKYKGEALLIEEYRSAGYQCVELAKMKVEDQIQLFGNATSVAGLHGAGFVNLIWSKEPVSVNEYYTEKHFNSCNRVLCEYLGHVHSSTLLD